MKGKRGTVLALAILVALVALAAVHQPAFGADRVVVLKVPGCV